MTNNAQTEMKATISVVNETDLSPLQVWNDFIQLSFKKVWQKPGLITVVVPDGHGMLDYQIKDTLFSVIVEYPRRSTPVKNEIYDSDVAVRGLYRDTQKIFDSDGNLYYMLYLVTPNEVLTRYVSGYPTGVNNKSSWVGASAAQIAYDVVLYNMTASATTVNGRVRDAPVIRDMTAVNATSGIAVIDYSVEPGTSLFDVITDLAETYQFDFEVLTVLSSGIDLMFKVDEQGADLSTDRTASVIFDINLDNIRQASVNGGSIKEETVAVVGGSGDGASRTFEIRTGTNYSAPENDRETFVNARTSGDDELAAFGDAVLARLQAKSIFSSDVESSFGWVPIRDYDVGDFVTVVVGTDSATRRITSMEISFDQTQKPIFSIELEDFVGS